LIASACFPLRLHANVSKITAQIKELADVGLIVTYTTKDENYLYFTNWDAGNIRAKKSKYPEPENICKQMNADESNCEQTQTNVPYTDTDADAFISDADAYMGDKSPDVPPESPKTRFIPPTVDEVAAYCRERCNSVVAQVWHDFYESKGWMIGKNKMKDWKAAVRTWEKNDRPSATEGYRRFE
jgi:hypothetical protein